MVVVQAVYINIGGVRMKVLSKKEFEKALKWSAEKMRASSVRKGELMNARKIFHNITDKNITISFAIYEDMLMDDITKETIAELLGSHSGNRIDYLLDALKKTRPLCPMCGRKLKIAFLNTHPASMVGGDYQTYWVCEQNNAKMCKDGEIPECDYMGEFSKLSPEELAADTVRGVSNAVKEKSGCKGCKK